MQRPNGRDLAGELEPTGVVHSLLRPFLLLIFLLYLAISLNHHVIISGYPRADFLLNSKTDCIM